MKFLTPIIFNSQFLDDSINEKSLKSASENRVVPFKLTLKINSVKKFKNKR